MLDVNIVWEIFNQSLLTTFFNQHLLLYCFCITGAISEVPVTNTQPSSQSKRLSVCLQTTRLWVQISLHSLNLISFLMGLSMENLKFFGKEIIGTIFFYLGVCWNQSKYFTFYLFHFILL